MIRYTATNKEFWADGSGQMPIRLAPEEGKPRYILLDGGVYYFCLDLAGEEVPAALVGNAKTINLDRMHFAMAGGWLEDGDMLGELKDESVLVNWLLHLFTHVRAELAYKERVEN